MRFIVQGYPAYAYTGGRPFDPKARALVFIHGSSNDHSTWQWQSRYFAHHGFTVLAPDLPAHGRSPGTARTSVPAMADWVAELIVAAGVSDAAVVGHSLGALVALDLALRHRVRVRSLVLIGASVPMPVGEPFLAAARDDAPEAFDMATNWSHARHVELQVSPVPGISLVGASRRLNGRTAPGVQHADLNACNTYSPDPAALLALDLPVLVVSGTRDRMTPPENGRALANAIPGARFASIPGAGHTPMSEAPRETLAALRGFLG
ncbi:alpha/beta fold hydrolase [Usitatibacter palustris]|uniref:Lipase 3 n=1 Tax=Usitatibacter palustris TaxID=2732487 RepID=A0A6M4H9G0_9PROT|nr:alpha/beta hydrolase [Usitatibacter palustris]QJR16201.1 Lipase 3 [Usitatibacter palustris]